MNKDKEYWDNIKPGKPFAVWDKNRGDFPKHVFYKEFKEGKPYFSNIYSEKLSPDSREMTGYTYDYVMALGSGEMVVQPEKGE